MSLSITILPLHFVWNPVISDTIYLYPYKGLIKTFHNMGGILAWLSHSGTNWGRKLNDGTLHWWIKAFRLFLFKTETKTKQKNLNAFKNWGQCSKFHNAWSTWTPIVSQKHFGNREWQFSPLCWSQKSQQKFYHLFCIFHVRFLSPSMGMLKLKNAHSIAEF